MIRINGLRTCLRCFEADGRNVSDKEWSIARGGYDLNWQLYHNAVPVIDCVAEIGCGGKIQNNCLDEKDFQKVAKIIKEEYPDVLV